MSYSHSQHGAYALILGEEDGTRRLPIIIGGFEAQSIALELEKMQPARPLTHDLFTSFMQSFSIFVDQVIIDKFVEGVFHAKIYCHDNQGKHQIIDSRTSDAISIALRVDCPFYTYSEIMEEAGIEMDDADVDDAMEEASFDQETLSNDPFTENSIEELKDMLKSAIDNEDYELASRLRDEINKRK